MSSDLMYLLDDGADNLLNDAYDQLLRDGIIEPTDCYELQIAYSGADDLLNEAYDRLLEDAVKGKLTN